MCLGTLCALEEINRELSHYGSVNVEWKITGLTMNSPAVATIHGIDTSKDQGDYGVRLIDAFVSGLNRLGSDDTPPAGFNETARRRWPLPYSANRSLREYPRSNTRATVCAWFRSAPRGECQ